MLSCIRRLYRGLLLRRARQIRHGKNVKRAISHEYRRLITLEKIAEAEYSTSRPGPEGRLCMAEVLKCRARRKLFEIQHRDYLLEVTEWK